MNPRYNSIIIITIRNEEIEGIWMCRSWIEELNSITRMSESRDLCENEKREEEYAPLNIS